jgi:thioredoxin 2
LNKDITYSICEKCGVLNRVAFSSPAGKSPVCGKCKNSLPLENGINELQASSLDSLLNKSPQPVIVDFWAPWCGPCRGFVPTYIEAASRLKNRAVFSKVDTQANPIVPQKFGIRGIPTIAVFHRGKEVGRISGALPFNDFLAWVEQTIQPLI